MRPGTSSAPRPFFRTRVECAFIDPPYNAKSAIEHHDGNLERSQWLSMMMLPLLREFLRAYGSIRVTIDDHEGHCLEVPMDEMFGRGNRNASCVRQKRYAGEKSEAIGDAHDCAHVFALRFELERRMSADQQIDAATG